MVGMMKTHELTIIVLKVLALIFLLTGVQALIAPTVFVAATGIVLPDASSLAEVRAAYGGLLIGFAVLFWSGATRVSRRKPAIGIAALIFGLFAFARLLSLIVDGVPNAFSMVMHVVETAGFILTFLLWRGADPWSDWRQ